MQDLIQAPETTRPSQDSTLAKIASSREVTEAQAAIMVAKRFPRDEVEVFDKVMTACQRPSLAEAAIYSYAKGGTEIQGASIRIAEQMIRLWGNAAFGVRELQTSPEESVIEAFAIDLESNVRQIKVFTVKNERTTKRGTYRLEDSRERYENLANFAARRLRACILGLLPSDLIEAALAECEKTLKAKADTSPEATKKMVEAFVVFGVTKQQIEKRIQRKIESITPAQVISLRKVYNSIKDGMSDKSDWFETTEAVPTKDEPPKGSEAAKQALRGRPRKSTQGMEAANAPPPQGPPDTERVQCPVSGDMVNPVYCTKEAGCPGDPETCEALREPGAEG